jgi:two-component system, chemotaxis family, CheB/CheR fusion protein
VGLGASAGGLEALEEFFRRMPADSGMAFAIVQHRSPDRKSLMPELLAKQTAMPVTEVRREVQVEPNRVYISPPNGTLLVSDCRLRVSRRRNTGDTRGPVDQLFHSLAEDLGDNAVCIILSGAGSDGTLGLKSVREYGGTAIAQAAESARWEDMPASAISAGLVDYVLSVEEMPAWLVEHGQYLRALQTAGVAPSGGPEAAEQLRKICTILRRRTGHDFSRYKQSTLQRRVQRRMQLLHANGGRYIQRLRDDPKEVEELFKDLLIGVTQFFRDKPAFDSLTRSVLPEILKAKQAGDTVRAWVPGCASGEEAYSIAMLLHEQIDKLDARPDVQIFATDIDVQALDLARQARYPAAIAEQVSPRRLARYFTKHKDTYQVVKEIRDMCTFSVHNLIKDPPFSRLDLVSCRNLLIYLDTELQEKVAPVFHYALRSGGFLFLGPSENLAGHPELFRALDKKSRIFQSKKIASRRVVQFPLVETLRGQRARVDAMTRARGDQMSELLGRVITEEFAPPAVAINEGGDILYFSGQTSRYLEPPAGAPNLNIFSMARKTLRLDLRTAIYNAIKTGRTVVHANVVAGARRENHGLNLIVRPLPEIDEEARRFLVVFQEQPLLPRGRSPARRPRGTDEPLAQELDKELRTTRAHLQTMIEELETSNEQLKLSNDDLLSMNEELQSANEELQTSKEELQSVNEELETVNTELNKKVEELDAAHSDLQNLFKSTQIAALFLDGELRIRRFTPASTSIFRLIESDIGRPIGDIAMPFAGVDLLADAKAVLTTLESRERSVSLAGGSAWFIVRILPYRTVNNVIDGAVITLVDVTELKRVEEQRSRLAAIVDSSNDAVTGHNLDGTIMSWNTGAERMYGYPAADAIGRPTAFIVPDDRRSELRSMHERVQRGESVTALETVRLRRDGQRVDVSLTMSPIYDDHGALYGMSAIAQDITARKHAESALRRSEQVLSDFFENAAIGLHWVGPDGTVLRANRSELQLLGYSTEEYVGHHISEFHADREVIDDVLGRLAQGETLRNYDARLRGKDGSIRHVLIDSNVLWEEGRFVHSRCFTRDVTDQKRAESALRFLLDASERLSSSLDYEATLRAAARLAVPTLADGAFVDMVEQDQVRRMAAEHVDPVRRQQLEHIVSSYPCLPESAWGVSRVIRAGKSELLSPLSDEVLVGSAFDEVHLGLLRRLGIHASLCVPLGVGDRVIGALTLVVHDAARAFGPSEIALAEELGRRTGIALENARLYREAQDASQLRDEFLATLSHELRTPLNAIVGWSEMLRQGALDAATATRAVETIQRNAQLQTQLISDILDVSRIIAGKLRLNYGDFDIGETVAGVVDGMRPAASAKGVEIVTVLPEARLPFHGDPARIQQIAGNLVANAVKFVPAGGHVEVQVVPGPAFVELSVVDNGHGIRPEYLPHIFERFRQGEQLRGRRHGGLGLGLAIVKHLVELHGGAVEAANRPAGKGAVFTVRLPHRGPTVANAIEKPLVAEPEGGVPSLRGTRVLVVDDEPDALEVVAAVLARCGAEVITASSAADALELLERERPHVLVSDIQMPCEDGYDLMRRVRAYPPERGGLTPALALTAYASSEDRVKVLKAGFEMHVAKPVQPLALALAVGRLAGVLRA